MTDLRTLLHDAAPRPSGPVDIGALMAEAGRRRPWRRIGLWFASLVAVIGIGGGAVIGLAPADDPSHIDTLPGPTTTTTAVASDEGISARTVAGPTAMPTTTTPAAAVSPSSEASGDEPSWYWRPPTEPTECELTAGGSGVSDDDLGGGAGFDDPGTHTCTFIATDDGGYRAAGTWSITIERDGDRIGRSHLDRSPACEDVGFILPGDVVTVNVRTPGGATTADTSIGAGPSWSCAD